MREEKEPERARCSEGDGGGAQRDALELTKGGYAPTQNRLVI